MLRSELSGISADTHGGESILQCFPVVRIIIPAYNEASRIERTVREYCEYFETTASIVVVANGCSDDTVTIVQRLAKEYCNLSLLEIPFKIGKGGAIRSGFFGAAEPFIGFTDADGSTAPVQFYRLLRRCEEADVDGAIASRWSEGSAVKPKQPAHRRIASRAFNVLSRVMLGLPYQDTQCGAKLFRKRVLSDAMRRLELSNFAFDVDLLYHLRKVHARIDEVPIAWADRQGSTVSLRRAAISMALALVRIRLLNSVFSGLPFVEFLALEDAIPVRTPGAILVLDVALGRRNDCMSARGAVLKLTQDWREQGYDVSWLPVRRDPGGVFLTFAWYVLAGHRHYDCIVEIQGCIPVGVLTFSKKSKFVLPSENLSEFSKLLYRLLYRGIAEFDRHVGLEPMKPRGRYRARFLRQGDSWYLNVDTTDGGEMLCLSHRGDVRR